MKAVFLFHCCTKGRVSWGWQGKLEAKGGNYRPVQPSANSAWELEWPSFGHGYLGSVACWFGDPHFGTLWEALSPRGEVNKDSLTVPLHSFLLRCLLNHLWLMPFILWCRCDLGSFQSIWFYVEWFVTAGSRPLNWSGLFSSSTILPNPTPTQADLFLFSFCLPDFSFKPSFFVSWDRRNNLLFCWKPHHVRVTT